ncbi:hypothetical protein EVAR_5058_1 [Eumeta japonica]|uniref:Uncharacterized protein n=1 Tax=Eumeta variegata TaxID=151549 RepID=A0A4C1SWS9_EUMVA|nr:hypothetical protein EVAR_5058_1 [Eumeta japonica]
MGIQSVTGIGSKTVTELEIDLMKEFIHAHADEVSELYGQATLNKGITGAAQEINPLAFVLLELGKRGLSLDLGHLNFVQDFLRIPRLFNDTASGFRQE